MTTPYNKIESEILKSFNKYTGNNATEEDFNTWFQELEENMQEIQAFEVDNIINNIPEVKFDYVTWLCDQNSDDIIVQITYSLKGGMSLIIDSFSEVPFYNLKTCKDFIDKMHKKIDDMRITNYTDIGGDKTQIIIDHNIK